MNREREEGLSTVRRVRLEGGPMDGQEVVFDFAGGTQFRGRPSGSSLTHVYLATADGKLLFGMSE